MSSQSACEFCGEDHATTAHAEAMRRASRAGKRSFIVRVITEERFRVWADDSVKAEDAVYWTRSSGRPSPEVDELGKQPQQVVVDG